MEDLHIWAVARLLSGVERFHNAVEGPRNDAV
jgi:hypothetical protein